MSRPRRPFPTQYAGVRFRSEEEARWAACFDALGLSWDYEPFDIGGYIPGFVVAFPDGERRIVEVKRLATSRDDLQRAGSAKLERSAWAGEAILVGASLLGGGNMGVISSAADGWQWRPYALDGLGGAWKDASGRISREPQEDGPARERIRATTSERPVPALDLRRLASDWAKRRGDSDSFTMQWTDVVVSVGKKSTLAATLLARAAGVSAASETAIAVGWDRGTLEYAIANGYMQDELHAIFQEATGSELVIEERV